MTPSRALPPWAEWQGGASPAFTVGFEEEIMLCEPEGWALAQRSDEVLEHVPPEMAGRLTPEVHGAAFELATAPHTDIGSAVADLTSLRRRLAEELGSLGLRAACAGTHPFAVWWETVLASGERYEQLYGSMRELVRREPTFGLHVHVGVPDPEDAVQLANRLRDHLPMLLALSANSPFWQGRDTGLASTRTPLFQAFPRTGTPRPFTDYGEWVETVDLLIRCQAFPEPTHLWWDVRPQPRFGTVEVRIMDAQTEPWQTGALAALLQSVARLELEDPKPVRAHPSTPEVIAENRFLAARDGVDAQLIDLDLERRVPVRELVERLIERCEPHAQVLGCAEELAQLRRIAAEGGAKHQLALAADGDGLPDLVRALSERFSPAERPGTAPARA